MMSLQHFFDLRRLVLRATIRFSQAGADAKLLRHVAPVDFLEQFLGGKTAGNGITHKNVSSVCPSIGGGHKIAAHICLRPLGQFLNGKGEPRDHRVVAGDLLG